MAYVMATEIELLAMEHGLEKLGFLTLTFADHVTKIKEASKRFNSLNTNVLSKRYLRSIAAVERQESQRLHFHLVVVTNADIRSGVDFKAIAAGDYRTAGRALRDEWLFWRVTAPKYRFGRTELLPVKSNAQGIGRYVGKYVSKHVGNRQANDKGARLVRFLGYGPGERRVSAKFSWNSDGGWIWRNKLKAWATANGFANTDEIKAAYGPRWCFRLRDEIFGQHIDEVYPSFGAATRSLAMETPLEVARQKAQKILESKQFIKTYLLGNRTYEK
jgi:hypothetical protein